MKRISLCITCAKAVPQLCPWINRGDRSGLDYKSKIAKYHDKNRKTAYLRESELVTVVSCQRYKAGPLPPLPPLHQKKVIS